MRYKHAHYAQHSFGIEKAFYKGVRGVKSVILLLVEQPYYIIHYYDLLTACVDSIKGIPIEFLYTFISHEFQFDINCQ